MTITQNASLLGFNTFGIDVKTDILIEYSTVDELREILKTHINQSTKYLHIGSGSNLLFLSDYKGIILHSQIKHIQITSENSEFVYLKVGSGVLWDDLVAHCVDNAWSGIENLSLIPGEVGAAAVQNIGAYGVEVQDVIESVHAMDLNSGEIHVFKKEDCHYDYRESIFKNKLKGKFIILTVEFILTKKPNYKLNYQHLEEEILKNGAINLNNIRKTIISIRKSKLPDTKVYGNAGSFFMNPVISKKHFENLLIAYPQIPHYYISEIEEKIPAAWLIDQCGWKGKQIGNAAVHYKQALVLINKGGAKGSEIAFLAQQIQKSVFEKFQINLNPEVNYI